MQPSVKARRIAVQLVFVVIVVTLLLSAVLVGSRNIQAQGIVTGFAFLERTTGWQMNFSLIDISSRSTYSRVLFAGLLNTILVGVLTLVFATLLGLLVALMRVSSNLLMKLVGVIYVEVFRNVPVILQVFFWYSVLTHLPRPRQAYNLGDVLFLSNRGLMLPAPVYSGNDLLLLAGGLGIITAALLMTRHSLNPIRRYAGALLVFLLLACVLLFTGRAPDQALLTVPVLKGLRFVGGITLKPEFSALLIGLVLFGAAYIGEIIRGGLLSVQPGKLEAGAALGLSPRQINRLIRFPLALRAMLPSLANQYIWLMKATTVGIAIGFPDYFAIVSTSINQSGQTLELLALLMGGFIIVNYSIGFIMNVLNARLKLKGRD